MRFASKTQSEPIRLQPDYGDASEHPDSLPRGGSLIHRVVQGHIKRSARDLCDVDNHSMAWIDPQGAIHMLNGYMHYQWATEQLEKEGKVPTRDPSGDLILEGWLEVSNLKNIRVKKIPELSWHAWKSYLGMAIKCPDAFKNPEADDITVDQLQGSSTRKSLGDLLHRFGGRDLENEFYLAMSRKTAALTPGTTLSTQYLKKLLAVSEAGDESWGSVESFAIKPLNRWIKLIQEGSSFTVPKNREDLFETLVDRGVPSWELERLRSIPEPLVRVVKPKEPVVAKEEWDRLQDLVGAPNTRTGDLFIDPAFNQHIKALNRALIVVKSKYPFAWKILQHRVKQFSVTRRGHGTEDGNWQGYKNGGTLEIVFKPQWVQPFVMTLLHELGHVFEDQHDILLLMDIYGQGHGPFVSNYHGKNTSEDFAETFREFWQSPANLKKVNPAKYLDMKHRCGL